MFNYPLNSKNAYAYNSEGINVFKILKDHVWKYGAGFKILALCEL